ncbi:MAG: DUF4911 domain-containing protein [Deltaproteobacteria bacterium]|nr:DUF4911 domain-containing protein [Deltaproteobacteria bacterium]
MRIYEPTAGQNCARLELSIAPRRIAFWKFILEGYDGLAVLSTLSGKDGRILLRFPECRRHEVMDLLNNLEGWEIRAATI